MKIIAIKDEFIKLGQAMKLAGLVDSGIEAKIVIQDGQVMVNGEVDTRRGEGRCGSCHDTYGLLHCLTYDHYYCKVFLDMDFIDLKFVLNSVDDDLFLLGSEVLLSCDDRY